MECVDGSPPRKRICRNHVSGSRPAAPSDENLQRSSMRFEQVHTSPAFRDDVHAPFLETQAETFPRIEECPRSPNVLPVEETTGDQICFGMLENISVQGTRSHTDRPFTHQVPASLAQCPYIVENGDERKTSVGVISAHFSKLLQVMMQEPCLELQAYITHSMSRDICAKGPKQGRNGSTSKLKLSVILYGPMRIFDQVGSFLSQCSQYLQSPVGCDRDTVYRNPQSLSGRDPNPPTTLQLSTEHTISHVETLSADNDPSSVLETRECYPEAPTPQIIRTEMYSHQRQALHFMSLRESGEFDARDTSQSCAAAQLTFDTDTISCNRRTHDLSEDFQGDLKGGFLADPMGLGKSLSIIALIAQSFVSMQATSVPVKKTLLVVPSALLQTWSSELVQHLRPNTLRWTIYHGPKRHLNAKSTLRSNLVITSYNVVAVEWRKQAECSSYLFSTQWSRIVLDEGHEIRDGTTIRARSVCALRGSFRWVVTGTPIQNRWEDLASQLKFLRIFPNQDIRSLTIMLSKTERDSQVRRLLGSICLRRPKRTIELPDRIDKIHEVEFSNLEARVYNRARDHAIDYLNHDGQALGFKAWSNALAKINTLRQICNLGTLYDKFDQAHGMPLKSGPKLQILFDGMVSTGEARCGRCDDDLLNQGDYREPVQGDFGDAQPRLALCGRLLCATCQGTSLEAESQDEALCDHMPACESSFVNMNPSPQELPVMAADSLPAKMRIFQKDISALPGEDKSIIFSFWTTTLDVVGKALHEIGISYVRIDGKVPVKQRIEALSAFNSVPSVQALLISLRCGSNGLNLTVANHVFLMEPQWNPMQEDQALDRVYRIGQMKAVTTIRYMVKGTLEKEIRYQQIEKRDLAERAFDSTQRADHWLQRMKAVVSSQN